VVSRKHLLFSPKSNESTVGLVNLPYLFDKLFMQNWVN